MAQPQTPVLAIDNGSFLAEIETPDGRNPNQNAWLTLTVRYSLDFLDSTNPGGIIFRRPSGFVALDSDNHEQPIVDWDWGSIIMFQRAFQRGERIWNMQFLLATPRDYADLDYETLAGPGWLVRPNVLCLFRLVPATSQPPHRRIKVVRLDPSITSSKTFRSNSSLYDHLDVWDTTLGHELGHALGMSHIKNLRGDQRCIADEKRGVFPDRCYGETAEERANIMGGGRSVYLDNAVPWLDSIEELTKRPKQQWHATKVIDTPPRKIALGAGLITPLIF